MPAHHFPAAPEQPIRAQFLHEDRLRALGESLARNEIASLFGMEAFDFQKRIREDAAKILDVYRSTNAAQTRGEMVTPAAQWLLDNNYLVEETIFQIKRDLPRRFYRELPTMTLPDGTTVPRALALAWIYVAHSDSTVAAHTFKSVVEGFQAVEPMKIGELWALPSLLRFVLIENLRRIAVRVNRARQMRQIANEVADRVLATPDDEGDRKDPRRLLGACARHDLRHAASLPAARRLAEFRQGAELAREGAGEIRQRRRGNHHRRASHAVLAATSRPATSSGACASSTTSTGPNGSRTSAASTRCCGSARTSPRSISPRATSTARRSRIWRGAPNLSEFEVAEQGDGTRRLWQPEAIAARRKCKPDGAMPSCRPDDNVGLLPGRVAPRGTGTGDRLQARLRPAAHPRLPRHRLARHRRAGVPADRAPDGDDGLGAGDHRPVGRGDRAAAGAVRRAGERGRARPSSTRWCCCS